VSARGLMVHEQVGRTQRCEVGVGPSGVTLEYRMLGSESLTPLEARALAALLRVAARHYERATRVSR
jgi:hypothetical protein